MKFTKLLALSSVAMFGFMAIAQADDDDHGVFPNSSDYSSSIVPSSTLNRYPKAGAIGAADNIPAGAGAPVPLNVFAVPRPYALGEASVSHQGRDPKGRATERRVGDHSRSRWDD